MPATDDKKTEGEQNKTAETEEHKHDEEAHTGGKAEKKVRKALGKLGMVKMEGVNRVTMKQKDNYVIIVKDPEVFTSPQNENSYIIFGELTFDDPDKKLSQEAIEQMKKESERMKNESEKAAEYLEECRVNGSLDDNPEYYHALEDLSSINNRIDELTLVLNNTIIFNDSMKVENTVTFGSTVTFVKTNCKKPKKYTIVSIYDSDVNNGLISINAPFAKEMLGCHIGDYFYFNDDEYIITNIDYSSL